MGCSLPTSTGYVAGFLKHQQLPQLLSWQRSWRITVRPFQILIISCKQQACCHVKKPLASLSKFTQKALNFSGVFWGSKSPCSTPLPPWFPPQTSRIFEELGNETVATNLSSLAELWSLLRGFPKGPSFIQFVPVPTGFYTSQLL